MYLPSKRTSKLKGYVCPSTIIAPSLQMHALQTHVRIEAHVDQLPIVTIPVIVTKDIMATIVNMDQDQVVITSSWCI